MSRLFWPLIVVLTLYLLVSGCDFASSYNGENATESTDSEVVGSKPKKDKKPHSSAIVSKHLQAVNCNQKELLTESWQIFWCLGKASWNKANISGLTEPAFIKYWQYGVLAAALGNNSDTFPKETQRSSEQKAFERGKRQVFQYLGVQNYSCTDKEKQENETPYYLLWCDADAAYKKDRKLSNQKDSLLHQQYIYGFISGRAIALSNSNSADDLLQKQQIEIPPLTKVTSKKQSLPEVYFNAGYQKGYEEMVLKIKEFINKAVGDLEASTELLSQ